MNFSNTCKMFYKTIHICHLDILKPIILIMKIYNVTKFINCRKACFWKALSKKLEFLALHK